MNTPFTAEELRARSPQERCLSSLLVEKSILTRWQETQRSTYLLHAKTVVTLLSICPKDKHTYIHSAQAFLLHHCLW
jgi:rhamnogalacturonyl hydrolase YesR